jgi:hypothetical protein
MSQAPYLLVGLFLVVGCSQNRPSETTISDEVARTVAESCGPELTTHQILRIVKDAMAVTGEKPSSLDADYRLSIGTRGCDYVAIGINLPETTPVEFVMTLDRSGKIKSWPWCCVADEIPTAVTDQDGH